MTKRLLSFLLALTFIITVAPIGVFATDSDTAIISVADAYTIPGENVEVYVIIKDNPGVTGATLTVSYDEGLVLTGAEAGEAFSSLVFSRPGVYISPCNFVWDAEKASEESTENGIVMKLLFEVKDTVEPGTKMNVEVSYSFGDVYNNNGDLVLDIRNGYVTAVEYVPGDVNGDKRVTSKDTQLIRQLIAGGYESTWAAAGITVNPSAADVNDDGRVNSKDTQLIRQVVVGGYTDEYGVPITLVPVTPACEHSLTAFEAKAATCTEEGNIAYWYCESCNSYFSDAEGLYEISESDTVEAELGHSVVIDEAVAPTYSQTGLTEGSHCSVCDEVIVAQETIPVLQATYHAITYRNLQGAESPAITRFAEHEGIAFEDVPGPVRAGYIFLGWYTSSEGGAKVDIIEAGTTKDVTVFAHWKLVEYTITCKLYNDAPLNHCTVDTYTIEEEIIISDPEWNGLNFAYWTVNEGNVQQETVGGRVVYKIPKGSTGNVDLTANWRSRENLAVPNYTGDYKVFYDPETKTHSFVYELGTIQNVVVKTHASGDLTGINALGWDQTWETAFDESSSTEIGKTISNSVTKTEEWQSSQNWADSHSTTDEDKFTAKVSGEFFVGLEFGGEWTNSTTDTNSYEYTESKGGSTDSTSGEENSITSLVAYNNSYSHSLTEKIEIPISSPHGTYSYVSVGTVCVYAIVTYDSATKEYFVSTYSILKEDVRNTVLYTPLAESYVNANIIENEGLPYVIPTDMIEADVESFYYVKFDANNGIGEMAISAFAPDVECQLPSNEFTRPGYVYDGWSLSANGEKKYVDKEKVKNLANSTETVTLYARWLPNTYKVSWNTGVGYTITVNRTKSNVTGTGVLASGAAVYYGDELTITYTASTGYSFSTYGAKTITVGEDNIGPDKIYASATPINYLVTYDANGGTYQLNGNAVSSSTATKSYDSNYGTLPVPERFNCDFVGWYNGSTKVESNTQITTASDHTLVAKWSPKTSGYWTSGDRNENVSTSGRTEYWPTGLNRDALKEAGYTEFTLKIKMDGKFDSGDWFKADWWFEIYAPAGNRVVEENQSHWDTDWETREFSYTISLDAIRDDGTLLVWYDHSGDGNDDFKLGKLEIWTTAK